MSGKTTTVLTVDEVIALLKRSMLPTVVVEGADDVIVYRRLEDHFDEFGLSVLAVGGRSNILKIFERLNEIQSNEHITFIADKDHWVLTGVPTQYMSNRLFLTDGYSIENDLYRDGEMENILDKTELKSFSEDIRRFITWFSLAINRFISGQEEALDTSPHKVLDETAFAQLTTLKPGEIYPQDVFEIINSDYARFVRGKSLWQVISRQTARKGRVVRLNDKSFMEIQSANRGPLLSGLYQKIENYFLANQGGTNT